MNRQTDVELSSFSDTPFFEEGLLNIKVSLGDIFQSFKGLLKHEERDTYCLFGVDVLLSENMSPVLVEINDRPNLIHTEVVNTRVNIPAIQSMCCVLNPDRCEQLMGDAKKFELIATL